MDMSHTLRILGRAALLGAIAAAGCVSPGNLRDEVSRQVGVLEGRLKYEIRQEGDKIRSDLSTQVATLKELLASQKATTTADVGNLELKLSGLKDRLDKVSAFPEEVAAESRANLRYCNDLEKFNKAFREETEQKLVAHRQNIDAMREAYRKVLVEQKAMVESVEKEISEALAKLADTYKLAMAEMGDTTGKTLDTVNDIHGKEMSNVKAGVSGALNEIAKQIVAAMGVLRPAPDGEKK